MVRQTQKWVAHGETVLWVVEAPLEMVSGSRAVTRGGQSRKRKWRGSAEEGEGGIRS